MAYNKFIFRDGRYVYHEEVYADMPVGKYAPTYYMKHRNRGQALIFINVDSNMAETAKFDVENFAKMCRAFGFLDKHITYYKDKNQEEIDRIFDDFAKEDHSEEDCVLVAFITCDKGPTSIWDHYSPYHYESNMFPQLVTDKCLSLAGKPKLIFFQVYGVFCKQDGYSELKKQDSDINSTYKIPTPADFLIVHNTSPAIQARGSVFYRYLSEFCKCLKEMKTEREDIDLLSLLTGTIHAVSCDAPQVSVPMWTSTLIREVYFH